MATASAPARRTAGAVSPRDAADRDERKVGERRARRATSVEAARRQGACLARRGEDRPDAEVVRAVGDAPRACVDVVGRDADDRAGRRARRAPPRSGGRPARGGRRRRPTARATSGRSFTMKSAPAGARGGADRARRRRAAARRRRPSGGAGAGGRRRRAARRRASTGSRPVSSGIDDGVERREAQPAHAMAPPAPRTGDAEVGDLLPQRVAVDAEHVGRLHLVAAGALEHELDERTLDGADHACRRGRCAVRLPSSSSSRTRWRDGVLERQGLGRLPARLGRPSAKSSGTRVRPRARTAARSRVFSSSRTLPGQRGAASSMSRASSVTPTIVGAELAVHLVDEELDQLGDVGAPVAQRRHA